MLVIDKVQVEVPEFLDYNILSEHRNHGLRLLLFFLWQLLCKDVLDSGDVIELSEFFRGVIQRVKNFLQMLSILENESFGLVAD